MVAAGRTPGTRLAKHERCDGMLLINDGSIMDRNLRHQRLTRDELEAEPRQQSIGSLGDMRYAGLETNGRGSSRTDGS